MKSILLMLLLSLTVIGHAEEPADEAEDAAAEESVEGTAPRWTVVEPIEGVDPVTNRKVVIPAGRGYTYEIVDGGTLKPYRIVYDRGGIKVRGFFPFERKFKPLTEEDRKRYLLKKNLKKDLTKDIKSGLEATVKGATPPDEGCCDVDDSKKAEPKKAEVKKPVEAPVKKPVKISDRFGSDEEYQKALDGYKGEIESPPADFIDAVIQPKVEVKPKAEVKPKKEAPADADAQQVADEWNADAADETVKTEEKPAEETAEAEEPADDEKPELDASRNYKLYTKFKKTPIPRKNPRELSRGPALDKPREEVADAEPAEETAEEVVEEPKVELEAAFASKDRGGRDKDKDKDRGRTPSANRNDGRGPDRAQEEEQERRDGICRAYDAFRKAGVPEEPLKQAMSFMVKNKSKFWKKQYFSIADYDRKSNTKRFYLLNMRKPYNVKFEKVSHGAGHGNSADPEHDGKLNACGKEKSNRTRAGFFRALDYYYSTNGAKRGWGVLAPPNKNGLKLEGLTPGVNDNALNYGYVMHEAKYNHGGATNMGRSSGCPAFIEGHGKPIFEKIKNGGLHYNYAPQCTGQHNVVLKQVPHWKAFCN